MPTDPYEDFAERYHLFDDKRAWFGPEYETFFETLFEQNSVKRVLDCACGIGLDLIFFHTLGCQVVGSDVSEAMLAQAAKNLSAEGIDIPLVNSDFRDLPDRFQEEFDAVVCLTTSLPHLLEESELVKALTSMRRVLRDSGILVVDQGMCDKSDKVRARFFNVRNEKDFSRVFVIDYFARTLTINVLDLFHGEERNELKVSSFDYRIILRDEYESLLTKAGFTDITFFGSHSFDPYDKETSDRLILVARK